MNEERGTRNAELDKDRDSSFVQHSSFILHPSTMWPWRLEQLAVTVWAVVLAAVCGQALFFPRFRTVYPTYANAARDWLAGKDIYQTNPDSPDRFRYSPTSVVLLVPLAALPDCLGGFLWRLLNGGLFLGTFLWWGRAVLPGGQFYDRRRLILSLLLLVPLSLSSLRNGQANTLVVSLLLAGAAATATKRWKLAGGCLALACLLKVYPLVFALLLMVIYPRSFTPRFLAALALGLALPFLFQSGHYVAAEYGHWFRLLQGDDRRFVPLESAPRDLWYLVRLLDLPLDPAGYRFLQLGLGMLIAGMCLGTGLIMRHPGQTLNFLTAMACCWMILCGPNSESCTYILLAPSLAWSVADAWQPGRLLLSRWLAGGIWGLFFVKILGGLIPDGHRYFPGVLPAAALLFLMYLLAVQMGKLVRARKVSLAA